MKKVTVDQFEKEYAFSSAVQCMDVREPVEHAASRIQSFALYPLSRLSEKEIVALDKTSPTYVLCQAGNRACQAAEKLEKMGFADVRVIEGGMSAWVAAGKPCIRTASSRWSLERQVRMAAGFLVTLGIVLSKTAHPAWVYLSLFVACGLMFSSITNTCGMGMLLARMPWNQKIK